MKKTGADGEEIKDGNDGKSKDGQSKEELGQEKPQ